MHRWRTVYSLAEDARKVAELQRVSQTTRHGISLEHGLVGSETWWASIREHQLPLHHQEGTLHELHDGPLGDWPAIVVADKHGKTRRWTDVAGLKPEQLGQPVRIEYVEVSVKIPPYKNFRTRIIVRVQVGGKE